MLFLTTYLCFPHVSGLLRFMSSRNVLTLLKCLNHSFSTAEEFDSRPGLKFLIQKVSKSDVAANMYKQAGISLTFYVHTLLEICAHQDNICMQNTKDMLWGKRDQDEPSNGDTKNPDIVLPASTKADDHPLSVSNLKNTVEQATSKAYLSTGDLQKYIIVYMHKLKQIFDVICTNYVDLYLEKEGPNAADQLSTQLLVFLVAPDELPTLKREKSLKEMVAEKLEEKRKKEEEAAAAGGGSGVMGSGTMAAFGMTAEAVSVQGENSFWFVIPVFKENVMKVALWQG